MAVIRRLDGGGFRIVPGSEIDAINAKTAKEMAPYFNLFSKVGTPVLGAMIGLSHFNLWGIVRELYGPPLASDLQTTILMGAGLLAFALTHAYVAHKAAIQIVRGVNTIFSSLSKGKAGK